MAQQQKKNNKLVQILTDLKSKDSVKISKAIKSLEIHGDSSVIKFLCDRLLVGDLSEKNEKEIYELMSSLKDTSVVVEIMDILSDSKYKSLHQPLLTTIWNMKVDFSGYIDEFVRIAVEGDFMEALECLTIIENMQGPFLEEDILECQLHLKNYMENPSKADPQKAHLLSEIALALKDINENLSDFNDSIQIDL